MLWPSGLKKNDGPVYLVHDRLSLTGENKELQVLCRPLERTLPEWVKYFNFSNIGAPGTWMDRVSFWGLFECKPHEDQSSSREI